jgi:hypothetical protein
MFFGTYYRFKLRKQALKDLGFTEEKNQFSPPQSQLETLWNEYADLANLL